MTTFGERLLESEIHRAFIEYVGHRPDGDNVPGNLNLIPVYSLKSNVQNKMVPIGRNTLTKQMHSVASIASLGGKFKNSTGSKAVIQALRDDFDPLQISELTGYASPESMTAIILELWKNSGDCRKSWPVLM